MMSAEIIRKQAIRWIDALNNFLKVLQYDKRIARDKFFTNEGWQANIKSLDINGVSEYFYDETDGDDIEFLSFIDGNGFEIQRQDTSVYKIHVRYVIRPILEKVK